MTGFQERKEILVQQGSLASHILDHRETQGPLVAPVVKVTLDRRGHKVRME